MTGPAAAVLLQIRGGNRVGDTGLDSCSTVAAGPATDLIQYRRRGFGAAPFK